MQDKRVWFLAALAVLVSNQTGIAATFVGQATTTFKVVEVLDGTTTSASQTGTMNIALSTNYSTMSWTLGFDVDLLLAGGPSQSFETRLKAGGNVLSSRCPSACDLNFPGEPSPFSFPDANGRAGAGNYALIGSSEWTLTERFVTATRERHSPEKGIVVSGLASNSTGNATNGGSHYLSVLNYPPNVTLEPGFSFRSSWKNNGSWVTSSSTFFHLGRIFDGSNYLEVTVTTFRSNVTLSEMPVGDFNSSGNVDAGDYVMWRKGGGLLSPFLSNYSVWRSNFGNQLALASAYDATSVPEPASAFLLAAATAGIGGWSIRRRIA